MLQGTERGAYVHELELLKPTESRTAELERSATFAVAATCWAMITYRRGYKDRIEGAAQGVDAWVAKVRADPTFGAELSLRCRLRRIRDGRTWNVAGIIDVHAREYLYEIELEELVD